MPSIDRLERHGIDRFSPWTRELDGAVATPAFSFINDPDCGMYRIGANDYGFAANGVLQLEVNTSGVSLRSAGVLAGLGTGANGIKLKNLKNAAASALSGTQLDVEIDIGGTPYYFTVYPTKA